ncbi:MgtC/SapB family protein [Massilia arenosa]|uniref:Protein MgtC n=1 Tax=Zemynaea arenosa TaxID=2561931 RepID=A0A4Y9S5T6_9BURK|nr:MgtC/SapB family protein [Massilia arenosa]TFW16841.1 MgtC/SapB family protein [Massilia arenosa]
MLDALAAYWRTPELATNGLIILNLFGALLLGLLVGYERAYHGRAAGMRTYGLVCMASCALTVIGGYPGFWFGGHGTGVIPLADTTRIVQGIVTGIGFLGAGVIVREGFTISGLTTAASIWSSAVTGVLVGVGFYLAAIGLALCSAGIMIYLSRIEAWLPSRHAIAITLRFTPGFVPKEDNVRRMALERGYEVAGGTLSISSSNGQQEWRFVALALTRHSGAPISSVAQELDGIDGVASYQLTRARN